MPGKKTVNKNQRKNAPRRRTIVAPAPAPLVHVRTPVFTFDRVTKPSNTGDVVLGGDPYAGKSKTQSLLKSDRVLLSIKNSELVTQKEYSGDKATKCKRLYWIVPYNLVQQGSTAVPTYDSRGTFADISRTVVSFKNVLKQPIRVIINSPRARIDSIGSPYVRRFMREVVLQPGKIFRFRATWGDKANVFTPMNAYLAKKDYSATEAKEFWVAFVLADFCVVVPDIDEMSGKDVRLELGDEIGVEMIINQHYIATTVMTNLATVVTVNPFAMQNLGSQKDMFFEQPYQLPTTVKALYGEIVLRKGVNGYGMESVRGGQVSIPEAEGSFFVLSGYSYLFKVVNGQPVLWDSISSSPSDQIVLDIFPPGLPIHYLQSDLTIDFNKLLGYLTAIVEVVGIIARFV
jgi:hypothetical protein